MKPFLKSQNFKVQEIQITALDRSDSRKINLSIPAANDFHIVFGHSPNFARGNVKADLLIAGHTMGARFVFLSLELRTFIQKFLVAGLLE